MIMLLLFGKASAREAVTCLQMHILACSPEFSLSALIVFSQRQFINEV